MPGVFEALQIHFHGDRGVDTLLIDGTLMQAHACAASAEKKRQSAQALGEYNLYPD